MWVERMVPMSCMWGGKRMSIALCSDMAAARLGTWEVRGSRQHTEQAIACSWLDDTYCRFGCLVLGYREDK